jgi:hypothetical protein
MKRSIMPLLVAALLCSCASKMESEGTESASQTLVSEEADVKAQMASLPQQTDLYSNGKTKVIKTVDFRFEVDDVKKSTEAIELAIRKYPAYIASSKLHLENPILENTMTIRVQSEYFQDLLKEIDQQARFVNFRDVKTDDVAKEFVDLDSRLKTKREVEERYAQILRNKAGTIEELFEAEKQIGELHEEIEATVSRINYLKDQVSYSTINLEFYQTITQQITAGDQVTWKDEFATALKAGLSGVMNVAILLTYLWPLFVITGMAVIIVWFIRKRKALNFKQV